MNYMDFVQQNIIWVMVAVISGSMLIWPMIVGGGAANVTPSEATLLINRQDAVVLDVRETSEWSAGHIGGARHISLGQLESRLSELEKIKDKPIIVVCATGNRSSSACGQLKKHGFDKVYSLSGGVAAWREANLPVTTKN